MRIASAFVITFAAIAVLEGQLSPPGWVAFSAELELVDGNGQVRTGRVFRDEHGCERAETPTGPKGSMVITIQNFEEHKVFSSLNGRWSVQAMRPAPRPRPRPAGYRPPTLERHEDFDVYEHWIDVRRPDGTITRRRRVIAPALDDYYVSFERPDGQTQTARNIRLGPQPAELFQPPAGTELAERPGIGGSMLLQAVVLRLAADGREPIEIVTGEGTPYLLPSSAHGAISVLTEVIDDDTGVVRVRVIRNAQGRVPGVVTGELLDELSVGLGSSAQTTKLPENVAITVTRIGTRSAPKPRR